MPEPASKSKPPNDSLHLTLDSKVEAADVAESSVAAFSRQAGYGEQDCLEIALAVRESVLNAILHGNCCDPNKKVTVTAEVREIGLVISIRDEGAGFEPGVVADPRVPDNLLRGSGRGILLIKAFMDEVIVRRNDSAGTEVTLIKHR